jgi:hypothetical protein
MNTLELTLQRKTDSGYSVVAALTRLGGFLPRRREGTLNLDNVMLIRSNLTNWFHNRYNATHLRSGAE